jgi:two-component system cell cycle response regulator
MSSESLQTESETAIRMLLVEDSEHDAEFIAMMLKRAPEIEVCINHVSTLTEAVEACQRDQFDIVLLDLGLPDSTGTASVTRMRACAPSTPIVVLTGDDRSSTGMEAIDLGAQDYLTKQHMVAGVLTRMMKHSIQRHNRLIKAQSEALRDGLTGLSNRRAFDAELQRRLSDFQRHQHPFCLALLDIDHFKSVNDRWGHDVGDDVIRAVAGELSRNLRPTDHVARYGGEEFAIVLSMTKLVDAKQLILQRCLSISESLMGGPQLRVTVSCGLAEILDREDAAAFVPRTDKALYAAKHAGRNRVMLHRGAGVIDEFRPTDCVQRLVGKP